MIERQKYRGLDPEIVCLEELMPRHHLLWKINKAIEWNKVYEITEKYYCKDNGRASVDPVVLVKMLLLQHIYEIPSMRRTAEEAQVNVTYRWFLGTG